MKNKKKVMAIAGAVALLAGVGMNAEYALSDYGMHGSSLKKFVMAQTSSQQTFSTNFGHQERDQISCSGTRTVRKKNGDVSKQTVDISGEKLYCTSATNMLEICYNINPCAAFESILDEF